MLANRTIGGFLPLSQIGRYVFNIISCTNWRFYEGKISFWCLQNPKGYTIPLDKRLAADGRGLQEVQINDNFAKLSEVTLFVQNVSKFRFSSDPTSSSEMHDEAGTLSCWTQSPRSCRNPCRYPSRATAQCKAGKRSWVEKPGPASSCGSSQSKHRQQNYCRKWRDIFFFWLCLYNLSFTAGAIQSTETVLLKEKETRNSLRDERKRERERERRLDVSLIHAVLHRRP